MSASATPTPTGTDRPAPAQEPVLSVKNLAVRFPSEAGTVDAVRGISFDLHPGETLGIVGESGSGKSVTSMAIMGLLQDNARITGQVLLQGTDVLTLSDTQMAKRRGNVISMIFQDPLSSLTPVLSIGHQITEAIAIHNPKMTPEQRTARAAELLGKVGIASPEKRLKNFPHEFSGGMRQRVMIAIAMANNPSVIICDEPTTALDVTVQAQVLELLKVAQRETGAAIIMITHDLGVVAGLADHLVVMYAGRAVEQGPVERVFAEPAMPYTMGLLAAVPRMDVSSDLALASIPGSPPQLIDLPSGCPFAPRCPLASEECDVEEPALRSVNGSAHHTAACIKLETTRSEDPRTIYSIEKHQESSLERKPRETRRTVLRAENLTRHFPIRSRMLKRRLGTVHAVNGVSFDLKESECLSIVGESGSGKSTALLEMMEMKPSPGTSLTINDVTLNHGTTPSRSIRSLRQSIQMVFQDPMGQLSPRQTVYDILAEPLFTQGWKTRDVRPRVFELLHTVGLRPEHADRFPNAFSGGQRQRIGVARALALRPQILVLDEPVSALDVSIQAGLINLLQQLKTEHSLSYLMVAHDLSVVRHISDRVAVMYLGRFVEVGSVDEIFDAPQHPYTQALLSAIPVPDPAVEKNRRHIVLAGDPPSPTDIPHGCSFRPRCPLYAMLPAQKQTLCEDTEPPLEVHDHTGADQQVACHYPQDLLTTASAQHAGGVDREEGDSAHHSTHHTE